MLDLDGFLGLIDDLERKRPIRFLGVGLSKPAAAKQRAGAKARRKRDNVRILMEGSGLPKTGGRPWTGPVMPLDGFLDDEERRPLAGAGGGKRPASSAPRRKVGSGAGADRRDHAPAPGNRIVIGSGSQPAVVKLVSFAAGRARVGKLLTYQSRRGELPVEDESGGVSEGRDWIGKLADEWAENDGRQPSKDVLRMSISADAARLLSEEAGGDALKSALAGHRIAWRSEIDEAGERLTIEVVLSAARRRLPGEKKAERIYDNRKSLGGLEEKLKAAFGTDAEVDVRGFAHGVEGVARYLGQLRRGGAYSVMANRMDRSGEPTRDRVLEGEASILDEAKDWKRDLRSQVRRDVAHIVISARPGTPKDAFIDAARAMLAREFADHRYLFTAHEDRRHIHVHAVIKMQSETGERLHPKIDDLRRWRRTIAEEARERDIPMDAGSRFERANPPGYKMKDIRRVERGEASEATRRRVEAVRDGAIHVPVRREGKRRAQAAAIGWTADAERIVTQPDRLEPLERPDAVRLYRAERQDVRSSAPLFTRDREVAAQRVIRDGGLLRFIDVPIAEMSMLVPSRQDPENVFVVPRILSDASEVIDVALPSLVERLRARTAAAAGFDQTAVERNSDTQPETTREPEMADLNVMTTAFAEMETNLDQIGQNLPPERLQEFDGLRKKLKVSQTKMVETQKEIEKKRGSIEGESHVTPVPHQFAAFIAEKRGEDIRYSHRKADGRVGAVAFTDHGDRVEIGNWRDRETVLAAMQLGAEKWGAVTVNGTDRYKALAVELAAQHGFRLTNPELQDALAAARDRVALQRPEEASVAAGLPERLHQTATERQPAGSAIGKENASQTEPESADRSQPQFVDAGDKIRLSDRDPAAMLAAMREAAKKWDTIAVTGNDQDKALAVELAAEHGFTISNPELQDQVKAAQAKIADRRAREEALERKQPGFVDGAEIAAETLKQSAAAVPVEVEKRPVDTGDKVKPADRDRDSMLIAMRTASEKWGAISVNGTDREKAIAVELAAEHGMVISNPELQGQFEAARAKVEERRMKEVARERKQLGFVAGTAETGPAQHTDAEIAIALETVKEKTSAEAARETKQARRSEKTKELPFEGGGEDHAYRTKAESSAARRAEKSVEQNPEKPIPADINQSPEIEQQRQIQENLLAERETNKQARAVKQRAKPRQKQ